MKNKKILKNLVVSFFMSKFASQNQIFIAYKRKTTIVLIRLQSTEHKIQVAEYS